MASDLTLPLEVIEHVIDESADDPRTLQSCTLICRQLRPRSFSLILHRHVFLQSRDQVSDFCDFLTENTELRSLIKALTIFPDEFTPIPLVNMLPHLSTLLFTGSTRSPVKLHRALLNCYHSFGKRIHTLSLKRLSFQTESDLFRLLLAFPTMTQVTCSEISIKPPTREGSAVNALRVKLSKQLRLETLHVRSHWLRAMWTSIA